MDVEIQTQGVEMHPEWRTFIATRIALLEERYPELLRVHVTLRHGQHHRSGTEEVAIVATSTGGTLRADKQEERMLDAIHAAFHAFERQVHDHHEQRRHVEKSG